MTAVAPLRPAEEPVRSAWAPAAPVDLARTLGVIGRGPGDPTFARSGGVFWRASRTPVGPATLALRQAPDGRVLAAAWGPGRDLALAHAPDLCGRRDDPRGFDASRHPLVREAHRRLPGLRLARTDEVPAAFAQAVMEQKVTVAQAFGAWRRIVTRHGERAPGPTPRPLYAPPSDDAWRAIPSWSWHRAGLEPPQARTLVRAAARWEAVRRAVAAQAAPDPLVSLPGVGLWTAAETRIRALGDPDAVSVGDYHLAHHVGYALTGSRTDDDGMLALLEPWRGQRQRVIRLLGAAGPREPRRGPKLAPEDHRDR
ncbi:DNA-3-methyladenine glycosylase family protein [Microbacterium excoecariae]|uniref:DNA-3-methyladenine glycosylase family protein n=1 Tax=Microbacterium excoecariae TaxID=2715210 RepID=UPI00140B5FCF|nr:DNA-3-methyladenine glycosylase 2 family protein [Microbacterium excoecariae]NHI16326.1 DNA-3-methyladenine glycosylase 2 family protein [Microbacterium excoecariae]